MGVMEGGEREGREREEKRKREGERDRYIWR